MPHNQTLATWTAINSADFVSPSGMNDIRTGQPQYAAGPTLGDYFDMTNAEALKASNQNIGILYAGRYRMVKLATNATTTYVQTGWIGDMPTLTQIQTDLALGTGVEAFSPSMNIVTTLDQAIGRGAGGGSGGVVRPVVFLGKITPGNYGFVQELGVASVHGAATFTATGTPAPGDVITIDSAGQADDIGFIDSDDPETIGKIHRMIGKAIDTPMPGALFRVLLMTMFPVVQD
jgi:hypothetical protein